MCWRGKVDYMTKPIANQENSFPELRCPVIDSVDFETIDPIFSVTNLLEIITPSSDRGTRFFVQCEGRATLVWPFGDWPMAECRGK
jgi:hypothetical protein